MLYDTVHPSVVFSSILSIWKNFRDAADSAHATALELAQMTETALNAANAAQSSLRSSEERVEAAEADSQNLRFELEAARAALEQEQRVSASLRAEQQELHTTAEVEHTVGRKVNSCHLARAGDSARSALPSTAAAAASSRAIHPCSHTSDSPILPRRRIASPRPSSS